jgi:hypothetical protein
MPKTFDRTRLSLALEALLWVVVLGWLVYLVADIGRAVFAMIRLAECEPAWRCPSDVLTRAQERAHWPLRSVFELVLLALLIFWPMVRTRIRYGYWMRDWEDHPARHFNETGKLPPRLPYQ